MCVNDDVTVTKTMTTLIEDVPNKCWASGPVGMSDGVMNCRKKKKTPEI